MFIVIDLILLAILAFFIWRGYKDGLVVGICGIIAVFISLFAGNLLANAYYADFTGVLEPFVTGIVDGAVSDATSSKEEDNAFIVAPENRMDTYWISFAALRNLGISENAAEQIAGDVHEEETRVGRALCDKLTEKLCEKLMFVAIFAIGFTLVFIIFSFVGNLLSLSLELPGLELANTIGGVITGMIKGILIILFLTCICRYFGILLGEELIRKTFILEWLMNSNPIALLIGV